MFTLEKIHKFKALQNEYNKYYVRGGLIAINDTYIHVTLDFMDGIPAEPRFTQLSNHNPSPLARKTEYEYSKEYIGVKFITLLTEEEYQERKEQGDDSE